MVILMVFFLLLQIFGFICIVRSALDWHLRPLEVLGILSGRQY
jgi:hypothetical protein